MRPLGLPYRLPRQEFDHDRLDVEHGRAIDRIELRHEQAPAFAADDAADRASDAIRAIPAPLRKDPDRRPVCVGSGVSGAGDDFCGIDLVKHVEYFDVGEVGDSGQSIRRDMLLESDGRLLVTPIIVFGASSTRFDDSYGLKLNRCTHAMELPAARLGLFLTPLENCDICAPCCKIAPIRLHCSRRLGSGT